MKRLVLALLAASLAACASEPPPAQPDPQPEPAPMAEEQKPVDPTVTPTADVPMPLAPEAKMTDTAEPAKPAMAEPSMVKPAPDKRTLVYLASYKTEDRAKQGFKTLAKSSPLLARQEPILRSFDLGPKGTWVRLYAMADDEAGRKAICSQVGKRVDECGARNRE